jgi:cell division protein FtsI/penicillin-binding protein 2
VVKYGCNTTVLCLRLSMRTYKKRKSRNMALGANVELSSVRLNLFGLCIMILSFFVILHLADVMILQHGFYLNVATNNQETSSSLLASRGSILITDSRSGESFPAAINHNLYLIYLDNRYVKSGDQERIIEVMKREFSYDETRISELTGKLAKVDDPYEPLEKEVEEVVVERIKKEKLSGIGFILSPKRFYPEHGSMSHLVGFVGKLDNGEDIGRYGIEGYWDEELRGGSGYYAGVNSAAGRWIPLAGRLIEPATDGASIILTIDRTLQTVSCQMLEEAVSKYSAKGGSVVITNPHTGAVLAMCNVPTFDANTYNKVGSGSVYNNDAIFTPYEPGSIFKPVIMSSAINESIVNPNSPFFDSGSVEVDCDKPIKNAGKKIYKDTDMRGVIENSINTGMVHVAKLLGKDNMRLYMEKFGFGKKTGIELDTEMAGNTASLYINKSNRFDCYTATASFGQGITVTPLQMAMAFGVFANGGILKKPYIVDRIEYPDGKVMQTMSEDVRTVITERTASIITDILEGVVANGQAKGARVKGYRIAGKTGTAQIALDGEYRESVFNHSFVGFGPVGNPKFVIVIKLEEPEIRYSSDSAAPTFSSIANFVLQYYRVPPSEK